MRRPAPRAGEGDPPTEALPPPFGHNSLRPSTVSGDRPDTRLLRTPASCRDGGGPAFRLALPRLPNCLRDRVLDRDRELADEGGDVVLVDHLHGQLMDAVRELGGVDEGGDPTRRGK